MNIYVIFYNNTPPRCSDPGQTLPSFLPRMGHFWGAPFPIPCSQAHSVWDWCPNPFPPWGMLGAHGGGKNQMQSALQTHKNPKISSILCPNTQIHAWTIRSSHCPLWHPRLQLQIQQNEAKPSSWFFYSWGGQREICLPSAAPLSSFPAGKAPRPRHSLHQLPCPGHNPGKAFWEKYPKPTFQSRGLKKAA